jgi:RNA polymerase sigma factor (sigma-70 family)
MTTLLTRHRARLVQYFERKGRAIQRHESAEDLAQGVHLHAIANQHRFEYQGEKAFVGWILKVARQYLTRRVQHWSALKRDAGPIMRITFGIDTNDGVRLGGAAQPEANGPGPVTHASRAEQLELAARAIDGLPPRDRTIVRMMAGDHSIKEIAEELKISEAAAQKARLRAVERFRKIYTILERTRDV